jgi:hypothetical protein
MLLAALIFVALFLVGAGVWLYATQIALNPAPWQETIKQAEPPATAQNEAEDQTQPEDETANWQTYQNNEYGFEMKYPAGFLWQDDVENVSVKNCGAGNFSQTSPCPQSARYSSAKLSLNGGEYWRCRDSEGAAGSRYENYWYFGLAGGECFSFKFTVKHTNCGVYGMPDEPAYRQCEESSRQKDETVKTIESTFKLND